MHIHRDVSDIVNGRVLRDVIQIHGMEIPYPAELWFDGTRHHEDGTAVFSIGDSGYLTAEYFGYDAADPLEWLGMGFKRLETKLILKDTRVEIPIWWIRSSPKARTWHDVPMPAVTAYKCEIRGRLGDPDSELQSVDMAVAGLPDVHLGQMTVGIPEENTAVENLILRGFKKQIGVLKLEAGDWHIELTAASEDGNRDVQPPHHVRLSRRDGLPFALGDDLDNSIIIALQQFLSFQCGRWVDIPTIVGKPVFSTVKKKLALREGETPNDVLNAVRKFVTAERNGHMDLDELNNSLQGHPGFEDVSGADILGVYTSSERATITFGKGDPTIKLAWVGKLSSPISFGRSTWVAADFQKWPDLFQEFWNQYAAPNSREHLRNAVHHYLEAQRIFDDSPVGQALVAAQSTLQALTRWWNGLGISYRFGPPGPTFDQLLIKAVQKAKLGQDSGVDVDERQLRDIIEVAAKYRNHVDHGRRINIEGREQYVVNCTLHHHNLARYLMLAKLGNRDRDTRGIFAGPTFTEAPD